MSFIINPYRFGQAYDADYQAVLDYATGQGWTLPSLTNQAHQNAYVIELKAIGAWTILDILYIFWSDIDGTGGGDSNFACINVKSPGNFTCLKVNSPTYDDGAGFTGNGSSSYLNTQFNPATNGVNYTLDNAGVFHNIKTDVASNTQLDYGSRNASSLQRIFINSRSATDFIVYALHRQSETTGGTNTNSIGFYLNDRNSSAASAHHIYRSGALFDGSGTASNVVPGQSMYICAENNAGSAVNFSTRAVSIFGLGGSLQSIQSDLYTAWTNYITP